MSEEKIQTNYEVVSIETGKRDSWTVAEILDEINWGHSEDYSAFDETDWKEGWMAECEGMYLTIPQLLSEGYRIPEMFNSDAEGHTIEEIDGEYAYQIRIRNLFST